MSMDNSLYKLQYYRYLTSMISENRAAKFDKYAALRTRHLAIVLEDIFQPHNASAVLRTCECFGIQDVYIIENRYKYTINPDIVLGATKWLDLFRFNKPGNDNTSDCISSLREKGYRIIATTPENSRYSILDLPVRSKTALLFGTEKDGLSSQAISLCDDAVHIPMVGFTESLNISVSAAICIFHLTTRMRQQIEHWKLSDEEQLDLKIKWAAGMIKNAELVEERFLKEVFNEKSGFANFADNEK